MSRTSLAIPVLLALLTACGGGGGGPEGATTAAPAFTAQPLSQAVNLGSPASFSAAASGNPAPTFQWLKDGAPLPGATTSTLSLPSAQVADAGSYRARAANSQGSVESNAATLTVQYLSITTQPQALTTIEGAPATFSVAVAGVPSPSFQWRKNGIPVAGATSAAWTFTPVLADNHAQVSCAVSNAAASLTSSAATLLVSVDPVAGDPNGVGVQKLIKASTGGTLTTQDGAVLSVPPGALATDTLISIIVPKGQAAGARNLSYILEPQGLAFSSPASLTFPYQETTPGEAPFFNVYSSSTLNAVQDAGSELTNWAQLGASGTDTAARTVTVPVDHFSIIFVTVDDYGYLVLDIPPKFLKQGDLLFALTNTDDKPGPDWKPGHVGMYTGHCGDYNRIVESTSPPGVRTTTFGSFKIDNGHIYLGPRRVASGASGPITDADRKNIVNYAEGKLGRPYSLVGDGSIAQGQEYSCVGLCEAAYQSVGKPVFTGFQKVFATVPLEMWRATVPVDDITVCPGEAISFPVYGVRLDPRSPYFFTTLRGWYEIYAKSPPVQMTFNPPGATLTSTNPPGRFTFAWTPGLQHAGQTFQAMFDVTMPISATRFADGFFTPITNLRIQQPLTIHVKTFAECALAVSSTTSITETHTVGTTLCPQPLGQIPLKNTVCEALTYTAVSSDSAIEVSPATGTIPIDGTVTLNVSFNCSKLPPLAATITVTVAGANGSTQITVPVTLNKG